MIHRFSSRRQPLDQGFLRDRLAGARGYDRIAGFFSSSILEVGGEALESVSGTVRMVCNSGLDPQDVAAAQQAAQAAMRREWCEAEPERLPPPARPRLKRLYDFLVSGKLRVKVVPDAHFGLIHGKAGVITRADGSQTAFLGSVNESLTAWRLNYELLWEDEDPAAVAWVQEEFDALWHSPFAVDLLLRRVGSSMEAGRRTVERLLATWTPLEDDEDEAEDQGQLRTLTAPERALLERFLKALAANQERDPKVLAVRRLLLEDGWADLGCIVFTQYFDSATWLAGQLTAKLPGEEIGVYAGAGRSGVMHDGVFTGTARDLLKERVRRGEIRVLIGTDAAAEGLNLQRLGTLINLDLPWNPSRLEQRKGRIQRIGQRRDTIDVCNLRYHAVLPVDWERCARVLDAGERKRYLSQGWGS